MNAKNIKKALGAKIDRWLDTLPTETKKLVGDNIIVTGGSIVSLLTGDEVHDYDVYFKTKESCLKVAEYYVKQFNELHPERMCKAKVKMEVSPLTGEDRISVFIKSSGVAGEVNGITDESEPEIEQQEADATKPKYRPVFLSSNAITLSDKIQIVIRFYGSPEEIHKNYDFVHCTCWYDYKENKLELPPRALEAIINKELYYMGSRYPLCSIIRTRKFLGRGWTINAGQYLKMALQLNELDLHNINVLEDQLTGVDSAYFMMAISAIRQRMEEDSSFRLDNSYLFEIINKIF